MGLRGRSGILSLVDECLRQPPDAERPVTILLGPRGSGASEAHSALMEQFGPENPFAYVNLAGEHALLPRYGLALLARQLERKLPRYRRSHFPRLTLGLLASDHELRMTSLAEGRRNIRRELDAFQERAEAALRRLSRRLLRGGGRRRGRSGRCLDRGGHAADGRPAARPAPAARPKVHRRCRVVRRSPADPEPGSVGGAGRAQPLAARRRRGRPGATGPGAVFGLSGGPPPQRGPLVHAPLLSAAARQLPFGVRPSLPGSADPRPARRHRGGGCPLRSADHRREFQPVAAPLGPGHGRPVAVAAARPRPGVPRGLERAPADA